MISDFFSFDRIGMNTALSCFQDHFFDIIIQNKGND